MRIFEDAGRAELVPMHIEAMMLGGRQEVAFASMNLNYRTLKRDPSGESLAGREFVEQKSGAAGVYLHFILPKRFTHGIQEEEGADVTYPEIPNRFTVTRAAVMKREGRETELSRKDWLVEGDAVVEEPDGRRRASVIGHEDEKEPYLFLGIAREYDGSVTSGTAHLDSLHALTGGIPYFCGYYPECKGVLGFYDALAEFDTETEGLLEVRLTYFVSGWVERDTVKEPVICHGLVTDLVWKGRNHSYETGIPAQGTLPKAAVGNCVEEAMAAMLSSQAGKPELEKVLKHLFFGTLPDWERLDGALDSEKQIHQYQFEGETSKKQVKIIGKSVNLTSKKQECLDRLRGVLEKEQLYEEKIREKRQQAYLYWRRYAMDSSYLETADRKIKGIAEEIGHLERRLSRIREVRKERERILESLLETGETLGSEAGSRYWMPKDLTFVLEGADQSNLYKRLDAYEREGKDYTRTPGQIISRVKVQIAEVTGEEGMVFDADTLFAAPEGKRLPPVLEELVQEGFFIARGCIHYLAEYILRANGIAVDSSIFTHTVTEYESCIRREGNRDGMFPAPVGVHMFRPSWNPLILEWSLWYYPDPETEKDRCSLKNWVLSGNDFVYQGEPVPTDSFETVMGRTVLSHHGPAYLAERFRSYMGDEQGTDLYDKLWSIKALSQCMEGLNQALLTRRSRLVVSPWKNRKTDERLTAAVAGMTADTGLYLDTNQGIGNKREPTEAFHPIRAGKLRVNAVRVIDNFGRVLFYEPGDLILPEELREGEKTTAPYVWLKPRILAPLRLDARWEYVPAYPGSDRVVPVCGWIWANLMDSCLHIYGSDGKMVGSIQAVFPSDSALCRVAFRNPPGETRTQAELLAMANPRLGGFIRGILEACDQDATVLYEFIKLLDEGLWTMQAEGKRHNGMSAFLGRPLALCTMTVRMDMKGTYLHPMFYGEKAQRPGLSSMTVPMRVGEEIRQKDGTVGFFHHKTADGFSRFHSCIKADRENAYIDSATVLDIPLSKGAGREEITVLCSPYGKVSLTCGLLPVKEMRLDARFTEEALQNIRLSLYMGPFLTPDVERQILLPKAMEKEWSYVYYEKPGEKRETDRIQNPWMEAVCEERQRKIEEGWLILKAREGKGETDGGTDI